MSFFKKKNNILFSPLPLISQTRGTILECLETGSLIIDSLHFPTGQTFEVTRTGCGTLTVTSTLIEWVIAILD